MDRKIIPQRKRNQPVDRSVPEDTSNQNQKRRHIPHTPKNSNPNKLNHTMCCNSRLQSITHYAVNNAARVIKVLGRMEAAVNHEYMVRTPRPAPAPLSNNATNHPNLLHNDDEEHLTSREDWTTP